MIPRKCLHETAISKHTAPLGLSDLPAALKFSARWGPTFKEIVRASTPRAGFATDKWRQKKRLWRSTEWSKHLNPWLQPSRQLLLTLHRGPFSSQIVSLTSMFIISQGLLYISTEHTKVLRLVNNLSTIKLPTVNLEQILRRYGFKAEEKKKRSKGHIFCCFHTLKPSILS